MPNLDVKAKCGKLFSKDDGFKHMLPTERRKMLHEYHCLACKRANG